MQNYVAQYFEKNTIKSIEPLAQAGSDRRYYRIVTNDQTFIGCESKNIEENETFFYFSDFFQQHQIPVPRVIDISQDKSKYIQEDFGVQSLLDDVLKDGHITYVKQIYKKALSDLVKMQIIGGQQLDFSKCYSSSSFDKKAILADLNYFKYYFLDLQTFSYHKVKLADEFEKLAQQIGNIKPLYFMYRDFQGRNIMIQNDTPHFIDYQGGMKGPLQYDVASLLWQAKAQLPIEWKKELYTHYKDELKKQIALDEAQFDADYSLIVLVRLLQVLGAYGLRGIIEKRAHFLSSIPLGLENIKEWKTHFILYGYEELNNVLENIQQVNPDHTFQNNMQQDNNEIQPSALNILIQSFSYKKGIPEDVSGNGGGFVFDCRGILNPGRIEEYKRQTGRDQSVKDFLESKTKVKEFLIHAQNLVDISIQDYIDRGFENLMISFGCTGGQHRSVYCTDSMSNYIKATYNIQPTVRHVEQEAKNWVN